MWLRTLSYILNVLCDSDPTGNLSTSVLSKFVLWQFYPTQFTDRITVLVQCVYALKTWTCTHKYTHLSTVIIFYIIFTELHGMQTRSNDENSVCMSVCQTRAFWQDERKMCPDFYTIWKIIYPSFLRKRVAQKCKVYKTWTISCDNSATVRDRLSVTINH